MSRAATLEEVTARTGPLREVWGKQLVDLGVLLTSMGHAMIDDDPVLGALAGEGVANLLSGLPRHLRELFLEYAGDEAARGYQTDRRYIEETS